MIPEHGYAYYNWIDMSLCHVSARPLPGRETDTVVLVPYEQIEPILAARTPLNRWGVRPGSQPGTITTLVERKTEIPIRYIEDSLHLIKFLATYHGLDDQDIVLYEAVTDVTIRVGKRLYDLANGGSGLGGILQVTGMTHLGFYFTHPDDPTLLYWSIKVSAEKLLRRGQVTFQRQHMFESCSIYTNRVFERYAAVTI